MAGNSSPSNKAIERSNLNATQTSERKIKADVDNLKDLFQVETFLQEVFQSFFASTWRHVIAKASITNKTLITIPVDWSQLLAYAARVGKAKQIIDAVNFVNAKDPKKLLRILEQAAWRILVIENPQLERLNPKIFVALYNWSQPQEPDAVYDNIGKLIEVRIILGKDLTQGVKIEFGMAIRRFKAGKYPKEFIVEFQGDLAGCFASGEEVVVTGFVTQRRWRGKSNQVVLEVLGERGWADKYLKPVEEVEKDQRGEDSDQEDSPLRKTIRFSWIQQIYAAPKREFSKSGDLVSNEILFRLYLARGEPGEPPIIIYDSDGLVNPRRLEYALRHLSPEEVDELLQKIPEPVRKKIEKLVLLGLADVFFTPVPRLRDPSVLKKMDWEGFVAEIINPKNSVKYRPLLLVRQATLLRGIKQAVNPHSLIVLPPQTGKSEWYGAIGVRVDKARAASLIGYADVNGPRYGSLHASELPYCIDQLEESEAPEILRYLFNLMEDGEARVDNAAYPFGIWSLSIINLLANPIGSPKNNFGYLLGHMSKNPALGRRFGIILYDYDREGHQVPRVEKRERDLKELLSPRISFFRAVEEYARPRIRKIVDEAWDWLTEKNETWVKQALDVLTVVDSEETRNLHEFLTYFVTLGNTHTRGGALYAAIVANLDQIALGDYDLNDILTDAEEFLAELLDINYFSLKNIVESFEETREEAVARLFDSFPIYLKEIVSAVELVKRKITKVPVTIPLSKIRYKPGSPKFGYFSEVLRDARKSNPQRWNSKLKDYFGFELKREDNDLTATIISMSPAPIDPLGYLGDLGDLGIPLREEENKESVQNTAAPGFSNTNSMKSTSLEPTPKNTKTPKSHNDKEVETRLICSRCFDDVRKTSIFIDTVDHRAGLGLCEFCGEKDAEFIVKVRKGGC
mgnify:CR=1 FL=1